MSILKLKDFQGNWVGVPTVKGDTGNGISSAVLNDDYTLTLTFTDGTTYKTPSIRGEKGEKGEPATDMEIHICSASEYDSETRIPTIANPNDKTFYLVPTEDGTSPDLFTEWVYVNNAWEMFGSMKIDLSGYLTDVTVDGTSVVNDGVAEIPVGTTSAYGVFKRPNPVQIKNGNVESVVINTANQHVATFYGLAKASGTDESTSELPFGQYTDEAKSSIQNMLGITDKYSPKEWVAESETELVANAHSVGDLFYIGETLYKVIADLNAGDAVNVGVNVEEVNVNDILDDYATKEDIQDNVSIVEKSASGAVASFSDGADDIPLKSLVVNIDPVQDLHGYDSPWVGGGGKNKIPFPYVSNSGTVDGITYTIGDDGKITATGTTERGTNFYFARNIVLTAGTYTASVIGDFIGMNFMFYDPVNRVTVCNILPAEYYHYKTFTIENDTSINIYLNNGNKNVDVNISAYFQLEQGSIATSYAPYENICPISGWEEMQLAQTGKNLFNKNSYLSYRGYFDSSKIISNVGHVIVYIPCKPNTTYTVSRQRTVTNERFGVSWTKVVPSSNVSIYNKKTSANTGTVGDWMSLTITTGEDAKYLAVWAWWINSIDPEDTLQIELCDSATEYESFKGASIPISWQTEAGTVYGGKLDVLNGVLRVTHQTKTFDGTEDWSLLGTNKFYINKSLNDFDVYDVGWISDKYPYSGNRDSSSGMDIDHSFYTNHNIDNRFQDRIFVLDSSFVDAEAFKSSLVANPLTVYGKLKKPIEVQLEPHEVKSLLGVNNIFADTGDTSVEYFSQVDEDLIDFIETNLKPYTKEEKLYESVFYGLTKAAGVDMASSSNAIGTYTEEAKSAILDMLGISDIIGSNEGILASKDYSTGDLFLYKGKLYKATASIAKDATITPNTNCIQTTLIEFLKNL